MNSPIGAFFKGPFVALLVCTITLSAAKAQFSDDQFNKRTREQRTKVLFSRVQRLLRYRLKGLQSCVRANAHRQDLAEFQEQAAAAYASLEAGESGAIQALALYKKTMDVAKTCRKEFHRFREDDTFWKTEMAAQALCTPAALFPTPTSCWATISKIWKDMEPHCEAGHLPDLNGQLDRNSCFAGDRLLARDLNLASPPFEEMDAFFVRFFEAYQATPRGGQIDLWKVYLNGDSDSLSKRQRFLALMAFFRVFPYSDSGIMGGAGDYFIVESLKNGLAPADVFEEFHRLKIARDSFYSLWVMAARKVDLTILGININEKNHHDLMAAYLGCRYRNEGVLFSRVLPSVLGYGYETMDYFSHRREGLSRKESLGNFLTDTRRHNTGAAWGLRFCTPRLDSLGHVE